MPKPAKKHAEPPWADRSDLLQRPEPSVFRVRNARGEIIYVGMTANFVEERFTGLRSSASWWNQAASVDVLPVPAGVRDVLHTEIHRWHPQYNGKCTACGEYYPVPSRPRDKPGRRPAHEPPAYEHPLYETWTRLMQEHPFRLHPPWRNVNQFTRDVLDLIGPRPPESVLRLADPDGSWKPGNICWKPAGSGWPQFFRLIHEWVQPVPYWPSDLTD